MKHTHTLYIYIFFSIYRYKSYYPLKKTWQRAVLHRQINTDIQVCLFTAVCETSSSLALISAEPIVGDVVVCIYTCVLRLHRFAIRVWKWADHVGLGAKKILKRRLSELWKQENSICLHWQNTSYCVSMVSKLNTIIATTTQPPKTH